MMIDLTGELVARSTKSRQKHMIRCFFVLWVAGRLCGKTQANQFGYLGSSQQIGNTTNQI